ncbi:unnamed protein product, partial [Amoebophrya sp. A25]|eukprot:GSA25T00000242001.1
MLATRRAQSLEAERNRKLAAARERLAEEKANSRDVKQNDAWGRTILRMYSTAAAPKMLKKRQTGGYTTGREGYYVTTTSPPSSAVTTTRPSSSTSATSNGGESQQLSDSTQPSARRKSRAAPVVKATSWSWAGMETGWRALTPPRVRTLSRSRSRSMSPAEEARNKGKGGAEGEQSEKSPPLSTIMSANRSPTLLLLDEDSGSSSEEDEDGTVFYPERTTTTLRSAFPQEMLKAFLEWQPDKDPFIADEPPEVDENGNQIVAKKDYEDDADKRVEDGVREPAASAPSKAASLFGAARPTPAASGFGAFASAFGAAVAAPPSPEEDEEEKRRKKFADVSKTADGV